MARVALRVGASAGWCRGLTAGARVAAMVLPLLALQRPGKWMHRAPTAAGSIRPALWQRQERLGGKVRTRPLHFPVPGERLGLTGDRVWDSCFPPAMRMDGASGGSALRRAGGLPSPTWRQPPGPRHPARAAHHGDHRACDGTRTAARSPSSSVRTFMPAGGCVDSVRVCSRDRRGDGGRSATPALRRTWSSA